MNQFANVFLIGVCATAAVDLWALLRRRLFGTRLPDYAMVGRWLAHAVRGRVWHASIAASPRVHGERVVGWSAHYLIGISFASLLPLTWGSTWIRMPTLVPALLVGIVTVAAPFLLMQPAMGAGIAASRTPRPNAARLQSLVTHTIFGIGLYAGAWLVSSTFSGG